MDRDTFRLIMYQIVNGLETELLWNVHDGPAPQTIMSRSGLTMQRINPHKDEYAPDFIPPPGTRIIITGGHVEEISA